jgi:adenylylsulfate kinase-like enzyme
MSENQPSNSNNNAKPARIILITGMSGAGRSATLKVLEDIGYEAIEKRLGRPGYARTLLDAAYARKEAA